MHTHTNRHTFSFSFFPPSLLSSLFICSHNREGGGGKGKKKKAGVGRGILVALQDWVWYCAVLLYCQTLWNTSSGLFLIFFFFFFFPRSCFFFFLFFCFAFLLFPAYAIIMLSARVPMDGFDGVVAGEESKWKERESVWKRKRTKVRIQLPTEGGKKDKTELRRHL